MLFCKRYDLFSQFTRQRTTFSNVKHDDTYESVIYNLHRERERLFKNMGPDRQKSPHSGGEIPSTDDTSFRTGSPHSSSRSTLQRDVGMCQIQGWNVL